MLEEGCQQPPVVVEQVRGARLAHRIVVREGERPRREVDRDDEGRRRPSPPDGPEGDADRRRVGTVRVDGRHPGHQVAEGRILAEVPRDGDHGTVRIDESDGRSDVAGVATDEDEQGRAQHHVLTDSGGPGDLRHLALDVGAQVGGGADHRVDGDAIDALEQVGDEQGRRAPRPDRRLIGDRCHRVALDRVRSRAWWWARRPETTSPTIEYPGPGSRYREPGAAAGYPGSVPPGVEVVFSLVGENRLDRWTDQMLNAVLAIRRFGGSLADVPVMVGLVDGVRRDLGKALEAQGASVRAVPLLHEEYRYTNKMSMLDLPDGLAPDVIVCLDVDVLVLGDIAPFLRTTAVAARTAGVDRCPEELWIRLFDHFQLPVPEERHELLTGQRSFRYANTGVVVVPWEHRVAVRERWHDYTRRLWEVGDWLPRKFLADQYAFAFATYALGLPFEYLPLHLNLEPRSRRPATPTTSGSSSGRPTSCTTTRTSDHRARSSRRRGRRRPSSSSGSTPVGARSTAHPAPSPSGCPARSPRASSTGGRGSCTRPRGRRAGRVTRRVKPGSR